MPKELKVNQRRLVVIAVDTMTVPPAEEGGEPTTEEVVTARVDYVVGASDTEELNRNQSHQLELTATMKTKAADLVNWAVGKAVTAESTPE